MRTKECAILSEEDSSTFFRLFIPLLAAVNQAYGISDDLDEQLRAGRPSFIELGEVAKALWEDTGFLDEYITQYSEHYGLPDEDRRILEGWKYPVTAAFVLERHLSRGSIFIDPETEKTYLVKGLTQTWKEMIPELKPPFLIFKPPSHPALLQDCERALLISCVTGKSPRSWTPSPRFAAGAGSHVGIRMLCQFMPDA